MLPRIFEVKEHMSMDWIFACNWSFCCCDDDCIVFASKYFTGPRRMVCRISIGVLLNENWTRNYCGNSSVVVIGWNDNTHLFPLKHFKMSNAPPFSVIPYSFLLSFFLFSDLQVDQKKKNIKLLTCSLVSFLY